jgi:CCR4-NOT transcription complex subunit 1
LKAILVEAYHKGQQELLYVVPFVAKILESCAKSKVFKPPNPWTLGIMNVLAELHQEPDLKLNLKFEVEVLCKTLSIDIHDLKPGMVFKDHNRLSRIEPQLSQPQMYQSAPQMQMMQQQQQQQLPPPPPQLASSPAQMQPQTGTTTPTPAHAVQGQPEPRFSYLDINVTSLAGLAQHLVVNNNIPLLTTHPNLRILIRPAVERAVQECIHPVVEWSMKIALTTCEQIIKKDFSLDSDDTRMRAAAHHMVRSLSAGKFLPIIIMITP